MRMLKLVIVLLSTSLIICKIVKRATDGPFWPENTIAYEFDISFAEHDKEQIINAMEIFEKSLKVGNQSCLKFVERQSEADFLLFVNGTGCSSIVGYHGGLHVINLNTIDCMSNPTIMHEIMHR